MEKRSFSKDPILNSPYKEPERHWVLDKKGMPTGEVEHGRRVSKFLIPIPKAMREQRQRIGDLYWQEEREKGNETVNDLRHEIQEWRKGGRPGISDETQQLLQHWEEGDVFPRLFFCQIEAVETLIWLNDVAPTSRKKKVKELRKKLRFAHDDANAGLWRLAAKMATGAGKTTVMAMLIAYHAINKSRSPRNKERYSDQFLIITPGITIKDRLRVLLPQDPNNYYARNNIVPPEMLAEVKKATVIITNYHAFKRREKVKISGRQRKILRGNDEKDIPTAETPGQMLLRICPGFLENPERVVVINDEAHHCYIHKKEEDAGGVGQDEQEDDERNKEAARLWMNGILALREKVPVNVVYDLSATPFFLRGSGYEEGDLFPWVVSDFSLMDAIESGIVKLPSVPIRDATKKDLPTNRNLYEHIRGGLPHHGAGNQGQMDPQRIPSKLAGALQTLYSHYEENHNKWRDAGIDIPPVFIIVCNNTSTSKLVYDYISGYEVNGQWRNGEFALFNNVNKQMTGLRARPRTLLVDSYQLESGDALSPDFRKAAAAEIAVLKEEMLKRGESEKDINKLTDSDLLREVMNTVGKKGKLGEQVRCVVSVSMLTEGWDTNNVTHILGVRAFGTQLLCEQVVGRALRRFNYDMEGGEKFPPEYAHIFGVPFNFAEGDPPATPPPPKNYYRVYHLDERDHLAITFPRVWSYRIKPPEGRVVAKFNPDSRFDITANDAPSATENASIVGESEILNLDALRKRRLNEVAFFLTAYIVRQYYKEDEGGVAPARFRDLLPIVRHWMQRYVKCLDGTFEQYLLWEDVAKKAAEVIHRACLPKEEDSGKILPVINPFDPKGSSIYVDYPSCKELRHETVRSHINLAVCDSEWEMQFCQLLEKTPAVFSYVRNEGLHFRVPYAHDEKTHNYLPDFIVLIDDGRGKNDLLHLVVEIKGYRRGQARAKADTMRKLWIPAVNNHGGFGRWAFDEIMDPRRFHSELALKYQPPTTDSA